VTGKKPTVMEKKPTVTGKILTVRVRLLTVTGKNAAIPVRNLTLSDGKLIFDYFISQSAKCKVQKSKECIVQSLKTLLPKENMFQVWQF
jgi:hypothetical protein